MPLLARGGGRPAARAPARRGPPRARAPAALLALAALAAAAAAGRGLTAAAPRRERPLGAPPAARRGRGATQLAAVTPCKSEAFLDEAIERTKSGQPGVLVISFSTTWCGPCKVMDPKVDELSETFAGKAAFIKVMGDKDDNDGVRIMRREGVRTVPLYQIYKNGAKVDSISGADPDALIKHIEKHVGS